MQTRVADPVLQQVLNGLGRVPLQPSSFTMYVWGARTDCKHRQGERGIRVTQTPEKRVGAWGFRGKESNSQGHERQMFGEQMFAGVTGTMGDREAS